ncbi:hypothetical protein D9615_001753 [Tricholomella constricta]|uniref:Uncharacterized protein n=1 Tax=Tricholomella constricta TaxID=117010 RepID=A0A8H5MAM4_9AGAR|nr:hypothetical protein D9615_001753 [Tricholomella constricta]
MIIIAKASTGDDTQLSDILATLMHPRSIEPSAQSHDNLKVPVAAIAGGIAAGAVLAIAVTVGWVYWGRFLKRGQFNQWREVEAGRRTKLNTVQNAVMSKSRMLSNQPLFARPMDRKVKFAGGDETKPCSWEAASVSTSTQGAATPPLDGVPEVSKPKPLRSVRGSSRLPSMGTRAMDRALETPEPPKMTHKASTVSSSSMYSTASGEEHQVRVPPNLILAAMGDVGTSVSSRGGGDRDRRSVASSSWSFLSRVAHGVQGNIQRYSQASSRSTYSAASRDSSGAPIGVAL